ncbi:MAG: TfoX domain-containing protein [Xanthobacteraceae bacterium]|nr:MAG: TfoX domain-containing protein [Xanthobacteraceae bacterium]
MIDGPTILATIEAEASRHGPTGQVGMFGGTAVLLDGNMVAALSPRGLLLRIGKDQHIAALAWPGTRPMEMRGKPMEGYVFVDPASLDAESMAVWTGMAVGFVASLPGKAARKARGARPSARS